jgi:hypothetical protein
MEAEVSGELMGLAQDILVTLFLIALRICVPLLILFAFGAWLKKLFEPQTTSPEELLRAKRDARAESRGVLLRRSFQEIAVWVREQSKKNA